MQWSKPVLRDLTRERIKASFDIWEMTKFIYGDQLPAIEEMTKIVTSDPALAGDDIWWMNRTERYTRACERAEKYVKICRDHNIPPEDRGPLQLLMGEDFFVLLHEVMFCPSLANLADEEQLSWWLEKASDYRILGTYAQTELTHGSNVRGLKTTATFDHNAFDGDGGWVVHTPSLEAMKWWPGGLAKSCNCCILMARVVIDGTDYGPHPFFFQVRDWDTHASLPGIELKDIGAKLGYNGMDNGGMRVTNVLIPRRHLLMKFVSVSSSGEYKKLGDQKMLFGTMTYTRLRISMGAGFNLAKACTTAVRYSAVRRQFAMQRTQFGEDVKDVQNSKMASQLNSLLKPGKRSEAQVLDYSSQQYLIFPQLALSFAMQFAAVATDKLYKHHIQSFRIGNFDALAEMHVLTSTLKAVSTVLMADGMEQCRKSLGGHGFLNAAGVGPQYLNALPQATYEGDFVVLSIQVGTSILKACANKMLRGVDNDVNTPTLGYIYECDPMTLLESNGEGLIVDLHDHNALLDGVKRRANFIHYSTAQAFQEAMMNHGSMNAQAIDEVKLEMMRMTYAHAYVLYASFFLEQLDTLEKGSEIHRIVSLLYELFVITILDSSYERGGGFGEFVAAGVLQPADYLRLGKRQKELLRELRPVAVPLVDSWNIPDFLLNSCLGRYDGRVYESLYEQTLYEPLNDKDIPDGYYDHLQYIMHPERKGRDLHKRELETLKREKVQSKSRL